MRILSALITSFLCGYSWAETSIVIDLPDAPLLLTSYDSQHQSGGANRGGSIRHMLAIEAGTSWSGRWTQQHPDASTFQEYGTGIAYIRKARLADGTVWEADLDFVLEELQEFFPSFLAEELNE